MSSQRPEPDTRRPRSADDLDLSDEHQMLVDIRDSLYEGSWDDFRRDLEARMQGDPHVFETVPASQEMKATIRSHLELIEEMRDWEQRHGRRLAGRKRPA